MRHIEPSVKLRPNGDEEFMIHIIPLLYIQGLWHEHREPDHEFYHHYFGPRVANYLIRYRFLRLGLHYFRKIYPWGLMIIMGVEILVIHPIDIFLNWQNKIYVVENITAIMLYAVATTGFLAVFRNKETCYRMICCLEEIRNNEKDYKLSKKLKKTLNIVNIFSKLSNIIIVPVFAISLVTYGILDKLPSRTLYLRGWYPYDVTASPAYEITLFVSTVENVCSFLSSLDFGAFVLLVSLFLKEHFKVLSYKLQNIKEISITAIKISKIRTSRKASWAQFKTIGSRLISSCPMRPNKVNEKRGANASRPTSLPSFRPLDLQSEFSRVSDHRIDFYDTCTQESMSITENRQGKTTLQNVENRRKIMKNGGRNKPKILENISVDEIKDKMQSNLTEFVKIHQTLLRFSNDWRSIMNITLMIEFATHVICLGATALLVTTVEKISIKELILIYLCFLLTGGYFITNFMADAITTEAAAVGEAVYSCDWLVASPSFKRSMLIIMSRGNRTLVFKPTGLNPLSLANYSDVSYRSYKMLATFLEMRN